jgi:hypothetical protein
LKRKENFFMVVEIGPRVSYILGTFSTTEYNPACKGRKL